MRVLIIGDSHEHIEPVVTALRDAGIESVQEMEGALGLLRRVADFQPDIILIDTASPSRDVLESLCVVNQHAPRPMLMFTADDSDDSIAAALAAGVTVYSVEGISAQRLGPVLRIAMARFRHDQRQVTQRQRDAARQQQRQLVDTVKGMVMARQQLTEQQAYQWLREQAMANRRSLSEWASELLRRWST